jgi:hypothetical protein
MNFPAISLEKFNSIEPQVVANYLLDSRWREVETVENHHAIWHLKHSSKKEYSLLLPLDPELPDFPNRMYDVVRTLAAIEKRSEAELFNDLDSAVRLAQEGNREILNIHLDFPKEQAHPEAPAKKLGKLLTALQDTVDAIGQFEGGRATPMGKIAQEITDRTNLDVIGTFKGSFGIRLASAPICEQLSCLEVPLAQIVIGDLVTLLNSSSDEQALRELMVKFQQRAASRYRQFLFAITDAEVNLRVEWGSANPEKGGTAKLACFDAWRAIEICDEVEAAPPEEIEIVGTLISVHSEQKTFRIRDRHEGTVYFGKISDEVFESGIDPVVTKPPKTYKARIQQTLEEKSTGESIFKNKLLHLEFVDQRKSKRLLPDQEVATAKTINRAVS